MNIIFMVLILIIAVISLIISFGNKRLISMLSNVPPSNLSLDLKTQDMDLVYNSLNRCFLKVLSEFSTRGYDFSSPEGQKYFPGRYRDLITYLLRPDVKISRELDNGEIEEVSFFEFFIQKIYLMYISETPENIKRLLYKYYSGYSINNYFVKKKSEPSCLFFINEYVRNKLWIRYSELETDAQRMLDDLRIDLPNTEDLATKYDQIIKEYDRLKLREINLNIYHMTDDSMEYRKYLSSMSRTSNSVSNQQANLNTQTDEQQNVFKVDPATLEKPKS